MTGSLVQIRQKFGHFVLRDPGCVLRTYLVVFIHPVAELFFIPNQVFGRGLKLPNYGISEKKVVHLHLS